MIVPNGTLFVPNGTLFKKPIEFIKTLIWMLSLNVNVECYWNFTLPEISFIFLKVNYAF